VEQDQWFRNKLYVKKKGCSNARCTLIDKYDENKSSGKFLFEAGVLPSALPQVVKLGPADLGMALDNHFLQPGRTGEECAFHADTIAGNPADGKTGIIPMPPAADDGSAEFLDALGVAFLDAYMDVNHVAGAQLGDIGVFRLLNRF